MRRSKMKKRHSKRVFKRASGTHPSNRASAPMRGGIRR